MKHQIFSLLAIAFLLSHGSSAFAQTPQRTTKKQRTFTLWGHVRDSFTKAVVPGVKITLMTSDSTLIDTCTAQTYEAADRVSGDAWYSFVLPSVAQRLIIRASHPDYEDCYVNYDVRHVARNRFFDAPWHYMKRRQHEDVGFDSDLAGVVVKATRIKMAYRGDTLVFDASAFKLPDGSMLDALVRQMPGVKLDDNGVITVNGRKVDYLMLNGKDFFKGDNKVMLDNLPYYTVNNIKVYDRTTDKSRFMGRDMERKEYVMDVNLKREYNNGYLGNATLGGGTGNHYMARLFASYFSDLTNVSLYSGVNNVNVSGNPNSQGNWNNASTTEGAITYRNAGLNVRRDSKDKKRENIISVQAAWTDKDNVTSTDRENFLSSGTTYAMNDSHNGNRDRSLAVSNDFRVKLPFWLQSNTRVELSDARSSELSRMASFSETARAYGEPSAVLDSVFVASRPMGLAQALINRTLSNVVANSRKFYAYQNLEYNTKLPWGDNIELQAKVSYTRNDSKEHQDYQLDYAQQTPDHRLVYGHEPSHSTYLYCRGEYYLNLLNNWTCRYYSLYEWQRTRQPKDYYRLDRLDGWGAGQHAFTHLPSADTLLLALSPGDSHYQRHVHGNWSTGFNIYLQKETDSTYLWLRFHLPVTQAYDRVAYSKAEVDTMATRSAWVMNGNINFTYKWKKKQNSVWVNIWHNTIQPSLLDYVVSDRTNPLAVTLPSGNLKNANKWEGAMGIRLTTKGSRLNFDANADYAYTANPLVTGFHYNPTTGAYTYKAANAACSHSGNVFAQLSGQWGRWTYEVGCRVEYGEAQTVELDADLHGAHLYDVRSGNVGPSLSLAYQLQSFYAKLSAYGNYEKNRYANSRLADFSNRLHEVSLYAQYNIPVLEVQVQSDLTYAHNAATLSAIPSRTQWLWNMGLTRSFLKGKRLIVQLTAVDLLRNISDYDYSASNSYFAATSTRRIGRMLMLAVTYNIFKK